VALILAYLWIGLAMSGPILLLLDRRGGLGKSHEKSRKPVRPGRLISSVEPVGRRAEPAPVDDPPRYTKAELAWIVIGGYWISLSLFIVPALSIDTPWALVGLLQVVAAVGLWLVVPRPSTSRVFAHSWTHPAASALLWTWPFAWICLIILSRSL
jgi:hypothetical protein